MNAAHVETGNHYDKYATTNPIEKRLMVSFLNRLDALLPPDLPSGPAARILEVGMGEGHLAGRIVARYPSARFAGVDLADTELADRWRVASLAGIHATAERLPFPDACFDLVLAIEVLEHVVDPEAVLAEIARVAKDRVVLTVPWEPWWRMANLARGKYVRDLGNTPGHIQHWTHRGFRLLVARHLRVTSASVSIPWTLVAARR